MRKAHMVGGGVKKEKLTENEYLIYDVPGADGEVVVRPEGEQARRTACAATVCA